jgi:uncharacterized protein
MRLLPREEKFFDFFQHQARLINEAAELMNTACKSGPTAVRQASVRIAQLETEADEIIHDVFRKLNQVFITPLDPEDIQNLASHLDNIIDYIEDTCHCLADYEIDPIPLEVMEFTGLIVAAVREVQRAINSLSSDEPVLDHCIEINRVEEQADALLRKSVAELFRREKDPIYVIKMKEIFELLELTSDACEDVADVLQTVIVKNS